MSLIPEAPGTKSDLFSSMKVCTKLWSYARLLLLTYFAIALCAGFFYSKPAAAGPLETEAQPIEVRVVLVTMFEIGADEGDAAGEFQLWKTRRNLKERFPFPHSHHDLYYNEESQILGMVTGICLLYTSDAADD